MPLLATNVGAGIMGAGLTDGLRVAQAGNSGVAAPKPDTAVVFKNFRRLIATVFSSSIL